MMMFVKPISSCNYKLQFYGLNFFHCYFLWQGSYVKDLSRLGRPMSDVLLVDNATYSYAFQPANGFASRTYIDEKDDYQLEHMADFLEKIADVPDLRMHTKAWTEQHLAYEKSFSRR
jgi:TFIIF-interacting CTD phosphatase-like protein